MIWLLRIGNSEQPFGQWYLSPEDDPDEVGRRLVKAFSDKTLVELEVSRKEGGMLRTLTINPRACSWWQVIPGDPQYQPVSFC